MPPNAAISTADTRESGDLDGFDVTKGREAGTRGVASNPREATARAMTEAVLSALVQVILWRHLLQRGSWKPSCKRWVIWNGRK
jgi:hypothetical protein